MPWQHFVFRMLETDTDEQQNYLRHVASAWHEQYDFTVLSPISLLHLYYITVSHNMTQITQYSLPSFRDLFIPRHCKSTKADIRTIASKRLHAVQIMVTCSISKVI